MKFPLFSHLVGCHIYFCQSQKQITTLCVQNPPFLFCVLCFLVPCACLVWRQGMNGVLKWMGVLNGVHFLEVDKMLSRALKLNVIQNNFFATNLGCVSCIWEKNLWRLSARFFWCVQRQLKQWFFFWFLGCFRCSNTFLRQESFRSQFNHLPLCLRVDFPRIFPPNLSKSDRGQLGFVPPQQGEWKWQQIEVFPVHSRFGILLTGSAIFSRTTRVRTHTHTFPLPMELTETWKHFWIRKFVSNKAVVSQTEPGPEKKDARFRQWWRRSHKNEPQLKTKTNVLSVYVRSSCVTQTWL